MNDELSALYAEHLSVLRSVVEKTLAESGFDALVIHSGTPHTYFADDQEIPFRSNPSFAHVLPLAGPHHLLFFAPGEKPLLIVVSPDDYWYDHSPQEDFFWADNFTVKEVSDAESSWKEILQKAGTAYVGDNGTEAQAHGVSADAVNPSALVSALAWQRSFKTPYEVFCIEEANHRASHAHGNARQAFLAGASELEIHEAYLEELAEVESALPYGTVVALDEKAAILHYQHKRLVEDGRVLLLDAGASFRGYAADITRTWVTESCDVLFRGLLGGVEKLQEELCAMAVPGVSFPNLHHAAQVKIGNLLREIGIVKISGEEAAAKGMTRAFFPHGLGHFLGIQVHDVGGNQKDAAGGTMPPAAEYPKLRMTRTIQEGMVFTIEPGVYFIPTLLKKEREGKNKDLFNWELIERLTPLGGIRIEDNIVATEKGNENLTRKFLP